MPGCHLIARLVKQFTALQQVVDQQQSKLAKAHRLLQHCTLALQQNESHITQILNQTNPGEDSETSFRSALGKSWKLRQKHSLLSQSFKCHIKKQQKLDRELHLTHQALLAWKKCSLHSSSTQLTTQALYLKLEQRSAKVALLLASYGIDI